MKDIQHTHSKTTSVGEEDDNPSLPNPNPNQNFKKIKVQKDSRYLKLKRKRDKLELPINLKYRLTLKLLNDSFSHDIILFNNHDLTYKKKELILNNTSNNNSKENNHHNNNVVPPKLTKYEEITDILNEISGIGNDLKLFEMENRKKTFVKLLEKMADFIDEGNIDIDEITDESKKDNKNIDKFEKIDKSND